MENASKALIIAGATLIGVLILTSMVYLFRSAAKTNENYDERQLQQQLQLYNSKFEYYNRDHNSILDMVSLINLAYDSNEGNDYDSQRTIRIKITINGDNGRFYLVLPNEKNESLHKNQVLRNNTGKNEGDVVDLYSYINGNLGYLGISTEDRKTSTKGPNTMFNTDTLSLSRLDLDNDTGEYTTIYKYWFNCKSDKIEYNKVTGRISNMEFEFKHMDGTGTGLYKDWKY